MARTFAQNPGHIHAAEDGAKFSAETTLVCVTCVTCGILYAIPVGLRDSALKYRGDTPNGWKLCCPLGHTWWYVGETEAQGLRRRLNHERDRAGRLAHERDQTQALLRGQKARASRYRNERDRLTARAAAGVCPCCNRTFKQLARHMKSKHPEYGAAGS